MIAQRAVNPGDVVTPGATLYQIIDPSSVRLSASVPSDQLGLLAIGQAVRFAVHGYPDQAFTGTISRIAPSADPTTKQIAILVDLPNPSHRLLVGLFAHGWIVARTATGVVAPISAVDTRGHPPAVLRVAGTTVERVPVQLGLRDPLRDEAVVTGIAAGDRILARAIAAPPPARASSCHRRASHGDLRLRDQKARRHHGRDDRARGVRHRRALAAQDRRVP